MRYLIPIFAAYSGLVVATTGFNESSSVAVAAPIKTDTRIATASPATPVATPPKVREVCSRNRPLQLSADGTKLASAHTPQGLDWAANIVQLFCRDVRINTIVVRDYCAVIRG